jgi:AAA domain
MTGPPTTTHGYKVFTLAQLNRVHIPDKEVLLEPWLTSYSAALCFAPSGVGKSWFGLSIAVAIAGGGEIFGWQADKPRRVLIIDGELDLGTLRDRAQRIIPAIPGADPATVHDNLIFWPGSGQLDAVSMPSMSNEDDHEAYVSMVRQTGAEFVLLDNLAMLSDVTDDNSAAAVHPIQKLLKTMRHKTGTAILLIHHSKKGNGGGEDNFRGSSHLKTVLDQTIELQRIDTRAATKGAAFRVHFHKDRNARARDIFPFTVQLVENEVTGAAMWNADTDEDQKIASLIAAAKSRQFTSMRELAKELDVSPMTITRWLRSATARGDISRREFDGWLADAASFAREEAGELSGQLAVQSFTDHEGTDDAADTADPF